LTIESGALDKTVDEVDEWNKSEEIVSTIRPELDNGILGNQDIVSGTGGCVCDK
jgi:hypothetical protein